MAFLHRNEALIVCNEKTVARIKHHAYLLHLFLKQASFLTESYILDFFVENLWDKFPNSWIQVIKHFEVSDLKDFLNADSKLRYYQPWPLTLLSFRASAFALSLNRKPIHSPSKIAAVFTQSINNENNTIAENNWSVASSEFEIKSGQHKNIPEFCRRHVKPKKQHEIFRMSEILDRLLKSLNISHVVDVGSGQGHLSRLLAFCHDLNVATIELDQNNVVGAKQHDQQALKQIIRKKKNFEALLTNKYIPKIDNDSLPLHLKCNLTVSSAKECLDHIQKLWSKEVPDFKSNKFALLGLHTCGSLAETILKTFVDCIESQIVISVGCCYMKIESDQGFPLSGFIKSCSYHELTYEAKEMACHAIEMFIQRLHDNAESLKVHCYRATLEKCIVKYYPNFKHLGLRGVKHAEKLQFSVYAQRALSKVDVSIPYEEFESSDVKNCLKSWKKVLIFYSLRLITAPLVESFILLDRLLYLYEKGHIGCISPIFDPTLSPRNFVLIAAKTNSENISKI